MIYMKESVDTFDMSGTQQRKSIMTQLNIQTKQLTRRKLVKGILKYWMELKMERLTIGSLD